MHRMKGLRSKASAGMDIDFSDPLYHDSIEHLTDPDVTMMEGENIEKVRALFAYLPASANSQHVQFSESLRRLVCMSTNELNCWQLTAQTLLDRWFRTQAFSRTLATSLMTMCGKLSDICQTAVSRLAQAAWNLSSEYIFGPQFQGAK